MDTRPVHAKERAIVYIAGSPRSGTTLLDRVLAGSGIMFGGGEMVLAWDYLNKQAERCPCGMHFDACPIWSEFLHVHGTPSQEQIRSDEDLRLHFEGRGAFWRLLASGGARDNEDVVAYRNLAKRFLESLDAALPDENGFIIDSSKSDVDAIWRPAAFKRLLRREVKVLHLYRDVRGVMSSHFKGSNMKMEAGVESQGTSPLVTAILWLITNLKALGISILVGRKNYSLINYEHFCRDPEDVLAMIARFLNVEEKVLTRTRTDNSILAGGHQVYGNRMRYQPRLTLRQDDTWRTDLPWPYRVLGAFIMASWGLITAPVRHKNRTSRPSQTSEP